MNEYQKIKLKAPGLTKVEGKSKKIETWSALTNPTPALWFFAKLISIGLMLYRIFVFWLFLKKTPTPLLWT